MQRCQTIRREFLMRYSRCVLRLLIALAALCALADMGFTQKAPPGFFVEKGACPFECCAYGNWKAVRATKLYGRRDVHSKVVATIEEGNSVVALTGQVETRPGRFVVKKANGDFRPGDVLWIYTPVGEGSFKVWLNGRMTEANLSFGPYDIVPASARCEETISCWGETEKKPDVTWWIKIKDARGRIGWTNEDCNFTGSDSCG